jgi:hypothetical protein
MMKVEDLKRIKDQRPVTLFRIRLADENEIEIKHPDAAAWAARDNPRLVLCVSDGDVRWIDIALVFSFVVQEPPLPQRSNGD